jgi:hypothetical protein
MRLRSLKHLLEAANAIGQPDRIVVIGSSSLLPDHPDLGDAGQPLEQSYDTDILLDPIDDELAGILAEAIGQQSLFAGRHGYYADILRPAISEALPPGWESRLRPVDGFKNVFALDLYDLGLVKLMIGRPKDIVLLIALLERGIIEPAKLRERYAAVPLGERELIAAGRNLTAILRKTGLE